MSDFSEIVVNNSVGCLCSSDTTGQPSGAMVFYAVLNDKLYIITPGDSLKAQNITQNPFVCLVIADPLNFRQIQLYCTTSIVANPSQYVPLLGEVMAKYSLKAKKNISSFNLWTHGANPVVIELTPTHDQRLGIITEPVNVLTPASHS